MRTVPGRQSGSASAEEDQCCAPSGADLDAGEAEGIAHVLKALADPVRLRLYHHLASAGGDVCVCDLPDMGISQPTVSHHLRRLREAGLVSSNRRGTWVHYRAVPVDLEQWARILQPPERHTVHNPEVAIT